MNNAITVLIYDRTEAQYKLSRAAVESALSQDIPVDVYIINNGSTCERTKEWLGEVAEPLGSSPVVYSYEQNLSPMKVSNMQLGFLFNAGYDHILGLPNDIIAPPNLYRKMLEREELLVTPGMHGTKTESHDPWTEDVKRIHGDIHMSAMLIRRQAYETLMQRDGYFYDEGYFMYASDCDLKMRLEGIPTAQLDILCWHYGGASHRLAVGGQPYEQADKDRAYFEKKWGHPIDSEQYGAKIAKL